MKHASVQSLIDSWPSLSDFARDAGVTYGAAKQMRRRSSIPVIYWQALIEQTASREDGVTADDLMRLHAGQSGEAASASSTEAAA